MATPSGPASSADVAGPPSPLRPSRRRCQCPRSARQAGGQVHLAHPVLPNVAEVERVAGAVHRDVKTPPKSAARAGPSLGSFAAVPVAGDGRDDAGHGWTALTVAASTKYSVPSGPMAEPSAVEAGAVAGPPSPENPTQAVAGDGDDGAGGGGTWAARVPARLATRSAPPDNNRCRVNRDT